jgi:pyrroline-5-carboxylate reductase
MSAILHSMSFLGAGNMAEALIKGVLRHGLLPPAKIRAVHRRPERLRHLADAYGILVSGNVADAFHPCETMILTVKPQNIPALLAEVKAKFDADESLHHTCSRVISLCAGVSTRQIEEGWPRTADGQVAAVIRAMPNVASSIGEGAAAVAPGSRASREDMDAALAILGSVGLALELDESLLNAVTALSGSGPAYVFRLMEAMIAGGQATGLPEDAARRLALQTVLGAAKLAMQSDESPEALRRRVTSPGGTTAAALRVMDERGFFETMSEAMQAAARRGEELGKG